MGDPTSVPEDPAIGYAPAPAAEPGETEPLWLKLPPELADFFDLGFVHTDDMCPYVVMRVRDDTAAGQIELSGAPYAFAGLARVIVALCESVPCLARHLTDEDFTGEVSRERAS
jgi:hypothetical protein